MAIRERTNSGAYVEQPVRRRSAAMPAISAGMVLGALATVGLIVSMFMSWRSGAGHPSDIPAAFLWDRTATGTPSLLIFLIPLAAVVIIGTVMPMGAAARLLAGIGTLIVVGVFAYQLRQVTDDLGLSFGDSLETGFYLAAISGVLALVSGLMPSYRRRRRAVVDDV